MKSLKVGIASYGDMKARTMAIARGELKSRPGEPEVWFTSIESFAKVLSDRNRALLRLIMEEEPQSLTALAEISGRAKSNLSRTLHTLERYHLVHLGVRLFFVDGCKGLYERHDKTYLTRRRRGGDGGSDGSVTGGGVRSA